MEKSIGSSGHSGCQVQVLVITINKERLSMSWNIDPIIQILTYIFRFDLSLQNYRFYNRFPYVAFGNIFQ